MLPAGRLGAALRFATAVGEQDLHADAVILALGGGSWARLGSDGAWMPLLAERGVQVAPLLPSNCGFDTGWSAHFADRYAGAPLTTVAIAWTDADGTLVKRQGQCIVTATGIEGSLIYALSGPVRDQLHASGFTSSYLLRGVIHSLSSEQFISAPLAGGAIG